MEVHEGYCENIYADSLGYLTFGIGHLITSSDPEYGQPCGTPVSEERVYEAFYDEITENEDTYYYLLYPDFDFQPDFVQSIVGDMMFNLGYSGLAAFENMKACVDAGGRSTRLSRMSISCCCLACKSTTETPLCMRLQGVSDPRANLGQERQAQ